MRRIRQQISEEECRRVLIEAKHGVLSVIGDDGYPYGVTLSHWFCEEDGHLYFHGAGVGHKIDAIRACDRITYNVLDDGVVNEQYTWSRTYNNVVVFGRIQIVEDLEKKRWICSNLGHKFTSDEDYIQDDINRNLERVCCLEIIPEHITGKKVNEK